MLEYQDLKSYCRPPPLYSLLPQPIRACSFGYAILCVASCFIQGLYKNLHFPFCFLWKHHRAKPGICLQQPVRGERKRSWRNFGKLQLTFTPRAAPVCWLICWVPKQVPDSQGLWRETEQASTISPRAERADRGQALTWGLSWSVTTAFFF